MSQPPHPAHFLRQTGSSRGKHWHSGHQNRSNFIHYYVFYCGSRDMSLLFFLYPKQYSCLCVRSPRGTYGASLVIFQKYPLTPSMTGVENFQKAPKKSDRSKKYFGRAHHESYWAVLEHRYREHKLNKRKEKKARSKSYSDMNEDGKSHRTIAHGFQT
jgi:hypothetical protein